ncbi:MAG: hypothetical protein JKY04_07815, partial [Sneathiella sp.]|nr:hypothetical protein [Sneathiella sp.]
VINFMRPVKFNAGLLEFCPAPGAPIDLAARLGKRLRELTDMQWSIAVSADKEGAPTVAEKRQLDKAAMIEAIGRHPLVQRIKETFKEVTIREVRDLAPTIEFTPDENISSDEELE